MPSRSVRELSACGIMGHQIAIFPMRSILYSTEEAFIDHALDAYADAVVGWQGARVIDAIAGKINNWETPEGALRERRQIPRYGC